MFDAHAEGVLRAAARARDVEDAALLAVAEARGRGVALVAVQGRALPALRFDPRSFHRLLPAAMRPLAMRAGLAAPGCPDPLPCGGEAAPHALLARAALIDGQAALAACAWGFGRVVGATARALGYADAAALAEACMAGVAGQADAMLRHLAARGLLGALARREWTALAEGWGGPRWETDGDAPAARMAQAYARWAARAPAPAAGPPLGVGDAGPEVAALQRTLRKLGAALAVDGAFGPRTCAALRDFQAREGLVRDGVAWAVTRDRLAAAAARAEARRAAPRSPAQGPGGDAPARDAARGDARAGATAAGVDAAGVVAAWVDAAADRPPGT